MLKGSRNARRRRGGFTLIEVLLVIAIIALLAAFVVPTFMGAQRGAEVDVARAMVDSGGTIATQLQLYRLHVGSFPESLKELVEKPDDDEKAGKWRGPYIDSAEKLKDPWGQELVYKSPGEVNQDGYDLCSNGPDKQEGGDDDICNYKKE